MFSRVAARCLVLIVLAVAFFANAQSTNDLTSTTDFRSFEVIVQRNIFNPNRYPQIGYQPERQGVPTFSLAGTMSYRKGMFAFFDGSRDEYRKALQEGGTIAGYTVQKITFDGVQLQAAGKTIQMKVGSAMRQEGDNWELSAPGEWNESSTSQTESSNTNETPSATPPPSSGEQSDVLKRLMQQREQELK